MHGRARSLVHTTQSRPAGDSRAGRSPRRPLTNKNIRLRPSFVALYMVIWCLSACPGYTVESSVLCLWVAYAYECVWTLRRYCLYVTLNTAYSHCSLSHCTARPAPSGELPTETRVERRAHRRATDRAPFCFSIWISGFRASRLMFRVDRVGRSGHRDPCSRRSVRSEVGFLPFAIAWGPPRAHPRHCACRGEIGKKQRVML